MRTATTAIKDALLFEPRVLGSARDLGLDVGHNYNDVTAGGRERDYYMHSPRLAGAIGRAQRQGSTQTIRTWYFSCIREDKCLSAHYGRR
jgi:hypothetical protein